MLKWYCAPKGNKCAKLRDNVTVYCLVVFVNIVSSKLEQKNENEQMDPDALLRSTNKKCHIVYLYFFYSLILATAFVIIKIIDILLKYVAVIRPNIALKMVRNTTFKMVHV